MTSERRRESSTNPSPLATRRWPLFGAILTAVFLTSSTLAQAQAPFETLHHFDGRRDFGSTSIVQAADQDLYITSARGGDHQQGAIFKMTLAGVVTPLHSFAGGTRDGAGPFGALLQGADGSFYGTTERGGPGDRGTLFRMTADGSVTILHSFAGSPNDGAYPKAALIRGTDGNFYGTTFGGGNHGFGTIFEATPDGSVSILHHVVGEGYLPELSALQWEPQLPLVQSTDGTLYGTTPRLIFQINQASGFAPLFPQHYLQEQGLVSSSPLVWGADGTLLGGGRNAQGEAVVLRIGAHSGFGMVLQPIPVGNSFDGTSGHVVAVIQPAGPDVYGLTSGDRLTGQRGRLFRMDPGVPGESAVSFATVYEFEDSRPDALVRASDGHFYGTMIVGSDGDVRVFRVTADGQMEALHTFARSKAEGSGPTVLVQSNDGNFYGTTAGGGFGVGTLFRMTASGAVTVMHAFSGGPIDGAEPNTLVEARDGTLYGTTLSGGAQSEGTVFALSRTGTFTLLHSLRSETTGTFPSDLIQSSDGFFYGTTRARGALGYGTVFRIDGAGSMAVLYAFTGGHDGGGPSSLVEGPDGTFYGTSTLGCTGRVFSMSRDGAVKILWTVTVGSDANPCRSLPKLVKGADGSLYGATPSGDFYRVSPADGRVTVLPRLSTDSPLGPLTAASDGGFYGLFSMDSPQGGYGIARLTAAGATTILHTFAGSVVRWPYLVQALRQGLDGNLYGFTLDDGIYSSGTAFRLMLPASPTNVSVASAGSGQVRLTWAPVAGATGYRITRQSTSGAAIILAEVTTTSFIDTTVVSGARYSYTVATLSSYGDSGSSYFVSITPGRAVGGDFDGDGIADLTVFRPSNGTWYVHHSNSAPSSYHWGSIGDEPVAGDYDGDGRFDVAVFRPSTGAQHVMYSSTHAPSNLLWGNASDRPAPGDYDGDGRTDAAVYRPSNGVWYVMPSSTGVPTAVAWGNSADIPVPGDYDGDGQTDIAVFRPSNGAWYIRPSSTGVPYAVVLGDSVDIPVAGDYDGDGTTDLAVFKPSTGVWDILRSSTRTSMRLTWGNAADAPVPGDYDGDGKADIAVFRPSNGVWYVMHSLTGTPSAVFWGNAADLPIRPLR